MHEVSVETMAGPLPTSVELNLWMAITPSPGVILRDVSPNGVCDTSLKITRVCSGAAAVIQLGSGVTGGA